MMGVIDKNTASLAEGASLIYAPIYVLLVRRFHSTRSVSSASRKDTLPSVTPLRVFDIEKENYNEKENNPFSGCNH